MIGNLMYSHFKACHPFQGFSLRLPFIVSASFFEPFLRTKLQDQIEVEVQVRVDLSKRF